MKKYSSISLIETLISLAIVGLSLVALMPVMTVKKTSTDPFKGNSFWTKTEDVSNNVNGAYITTPLSIGTSQNPKDVNPTRNSRPFIVTAFGIGQKGLPPLYVQDRLYFRGQEILPSGDNLILTTRSVSGSNYNYSNYIELNGNNIVSIANNVEDTQSYTTSYPIGFSATETDTSIRIRNGKDADNNPIDYMQIYKSNIGIGKNALSSLSGGENEIVIANMPHKAPQAGSNNQVAIGAKNGGGHPADTANFVIQYDGETNNKFTINANLNIPSLELRGMNIPSDRRLKNVIGAYKKGLYEIEKLKPVEFTYKSDEKQVHHIGVIAQDLQKVFPNSVSKDKNTGYLVINTDEIFYALLNSIKELDMKNKEIEKDNDALEAKIAELRKIRDDLKAKKGGSHE